MGWRPENWEEIRPRKYFENASQEAGFPIESNHFKLGVEDGADAMLKILTENKKLMTPEQMRLIDPDRKFSYGWLVFIADEKEGKE